jgi:hypothetical protein
MNVVMKWFVGSNSSGRKQTFTEYQRVPKHHYPNSTFQLNDTRLSILQESQQVKFVISLVNMVFLAGMGPDCYCSNALYNA